MPRTAKPKPTDVREIAANIYSSILDEVERDYDLVGSEASRSRLSCGVLVVDLITGGGLTSGMVTVSGQEQSGKSTLTLESIHAAMLAKIPIIGHYDAEGTAQLDPDYVAAILRVRSLKDVYGERVNGVWRVSPRVRYWDTTIMEDYFDSMVRVLNQLPDKIYNRERDQWFLRVAREGRYARRQAKFLKVGDPDEKLSDKMHLWIPTKNSQPQALIVPDSYVTFLPERDDTKEEKNNAQAVQARAFADNLRRIVGKFRRKYIVVFGTNQIRERPGMVMGPRLYEPAGNALKLYSAIRYISTARATPKNWRHEQKVSQYSLEPSVEGRGDDAYAYKHIKNVKNKSGTPWLECWTRVWVKDYHGKGRGFDPVFDTAQFLIMIGLVKEGQKHSLQFAKTNLHPLSGVKLSWQEFKALIIAEEYGSPRAVEESNKVHRKLRQREPINLRALCFRWLRNGKAQELFSEQGSGRVTRKSEFKDLEN